MQLLFDAKQEGPTLAAITADVERMMKEMGLREADFFSLSAEVKFLENSEPQEPCQVISFYGVYRPILSDETSDNMCRLEIKLKRFGDFWFGSFTITDPLKEHQAIAKSKRDFAYSAFIKILAKACRIGSLPCESRAIWYRRSGWRDLLSGVSYLGA